MIVKFPNCVIDTDYYSGFFIQKIPESYHCKVNGNHIDHERVDELIETAFFDDAQKVIDQIYDGLKRKKRVIEIEQ